MAVIQDQDRYFQGKLEASVSEDLVSEGTIQRLLNGRFIEGAITNAVGFDELVFTYVPQKSTNSDGTKPFTSPVTYQSLLENGDVQLVAPMDNIGGKFLVAVISGILYRLDLDTLEAVDITPIDSFLPLSSEEYQLSYLDNDGGTMGAGGYLVIFNYPNKTVFVNETTARLAVAGNYECPPARLGATGGSRLAIASGDNIVYISDPLGGASGLAPLTFQETLDNSSSYFDQSFTMGSVLDIEEITCIARLPRYMSASQDFLAQQLLVSTRNRKYLLAVASPRADWENVQFITYAGSNDGIAGPHASTNIGDVLLYISTTGRIKTIGQDQQRETALSESYMDDSLGQYLCPCETDFYHREWFSDLDHSRSILKFNKDRLYATTYPFLSPATLSSGKETSSPSFMALATATLASGVSLGPTSQLTWEGFYDWIKPIGIVTLDEDVYITSKDESGRIRFYKENTSKVDEHTTTIYTRGYFGGTPGMSKSVMEGSLYFRRLAGTVEISISYQVDGEWVCGSTCKVSSKLHRFSFRSSKCKTDSWTIPIKIEINHGGCRFELQSIRVKGESHTQEK